MAATTVFLVLMSLGYKICMKVRKIYSNGVVNYPATIHSTVDVREKVARERAVTPPPVAVSNKRSIPPGVRVVTETEAPPAGVHDTDNIAALFGILRT